MDTIFQNSYTRTKEIAKEMYRCFYLKRPLHIFFDIVLGWLFLVNLVCLILGQFSTALEQYIAIGGLFLVPLCYGLQFFIYSKSVKIMMKRDSELNHGQPVHVDMVSTNEFIKVSSSTGSVNEIPYSIIKKVIETKNLIFLRSEANMVCIFRKDSFIQGTSEEFIAFLTQKGFEIK